MVAMEGVATMASETTDAFYSQEQFQDAANYWDRKDADAVQLDRDILQPMIESYIQANNTCARATGSGSYVRCTPLEYSYHDGMFWIFSEGGKKFIGLADNPNVCLAIYDKYDGFGNLHGLQVMGKAEMIEPFSDRYVAHAQYKKITVEALKNLSSPMHLICIHPERMDCLFSDFKKLGGTARQTLVFNET